MRTVRVHADVAWKPRWHGMHTFMTRSWWVVVAAVLLASCSMSEPPTDDGGPDEQEPSAFVAQVFASEDASFVLDAEGAAWAWGRNDAGQLATGDFAEAMRPRQVQRPPGHALATLSVGSRHVLAVDDRRAVWAWGSNLAFALGNPTVSTSDASPAPLAVALPSNRTFASVAAGTAFSLALDDLGMVWSWGENAVVDILPGLKAEDSYCAHACRMAVLASLRWVPAAGGLAAPLTSQANRACPAL